MSPCNLDTSWNQLFCCKHKILKIYSSFERSNQRSLNRQRTTAIALVEVVGVCLLFSVSRFPISSSRLFIHHRRQLSNYLRQLYVSKYTDVLTVVLRFKPRNGNDRKEEPTLSHSLSKTKHNKTKQKQETQQQLQHNTVQVVNNAER